MNTFVPEMSKIFYFLFMADQNTLNDVTYISSDSVLRINGTEREHLK
jgi:hypothetical protein